MLAAGLLLGLTLWSVPRVARAQRHFAVEAFEPAPDADGSLLNVYGARTLPKRGYALSLAGSYGRSPLSVQSGTTGRNLGALVGSIGTLHIAGAVGLWDLLDVGVAWAVHRVGAGSHFDQAPRALRAATVDDTQIALGDLRLVPRVRFLARRGEQGVGLALLTQVFLPTGKNAVYAGETYRVEPRLALDWRSRGGLVLAGNVGYLVRPRSRVLGAHVDDMVRAGVGVEVPFGLGLSGLAEVDTQLNVLSDKFRRDDAPTEGMLAARFRGAGFLAQLAGGAGLVRGIGAPLYRLLAALTYTGLVQRDRDGDGVLDERDGCPAQAEDKDGFEDGDGCPDLDDDRDAVADVRDACPRAPEDHDGFADQDGCPDADNDADGVLDAQDQCPDLAEDTDGFADDDGCPDPDNDADGVSDLQDECVDQPEDLDAFQDNDGCPELDNDQDGVLDATDRCPNEAAPEQPDGCPAPQRVVLGADQIQLNEHVAFAKNSARIEPSSAALLDDIAHLLSEHPEITLVRVEGHTDDSGSLAHNRKLSAGRAAAVVRALVQRGIKKARMRSIGLGPERPLVPNESDEQRAQNRRVELHIVTRTP